MPNETKQNSSTGETPETQSASGPKMMLQYHKGEAMPFGDPEPVATLPAHNEFGAEEAKELLDIVAPKKVEDPDHPKEVGSTSGKHAAKTVVIDGETLTRERRKSSGSHQKKKRAKAAKTIRRVILIVVAILVVASAAAIALIKVGEGNFKKKVDYSEGYTIEHNGYVYKLNEDIVSLCFIGYDQTISDRGKGKAGQADLIMVAAIDTSNGKVKIINIPRDSMVEVDEMVGSDFIGVDTMQACLAYAFGDGGHTSCEYTVRVAQRVLYNMPISFYFALNMDGVGPLNNAIGGVTLVPLTTMANVGIYEGVETTLWSNQAIAYVRSRDHDFEASSERQKRQIQYVTAYAAQALAAAKEDPTLLVDLYNIGSQYSYTNLGPTEASYLASLLVQHGISGIEVVNLQGTTTQPGAYAEFILDQEAVYQTVLDTYYINIGPVEDNGNSKK